MQCSASSPHGFAANFASSRQSRNRTRADVVGARDLAHGLALIAPVNRFLLLVRGELRLAAETFAGRFGARPALAGAGADKLALELCIMRSSA